MSQLQKQIILSAICKIDCDGNILNKSLLNHIDATINKNFINTIKTNKQTFAKTKLLYNNKTCGTDRTRESYNDLINDNVVNFWKTNTTMQLPLTSHNDLNRNNYNISRMTSYNHPYSRYHPYPR